MFPFLQLKVSDMMDCMSLRIMRYYFSSRSVLLYYNNSIKLFHAFCNLSFGTFYAAKYYLKQLSNSLELFPNNDTFLLNVKAVFIIFIVFS